MNATAGYLLALAQVVLDLALAPGLVGLIRWLKARLQNRRGAPIWQPYLELRKLFAKEVLISTNASWLFRLAPYVIFLAESGERGTRGIRTRHRRGVLRLGLGD